MMVALRTSNSLWARSWRFMWRQPWFGLIMAGALFLFHNGPNAECLPLGLYATLELSLPVAHYLGRSSIGLTHFAGQI